MEEEEEEEKTVEEGEEEDERRTRKLFRECSRTSAVLFTLRILSSGRLVSFSMIIYRMYRIRR